MDWKKVPPLRPPVRPGMPILFPTGPGYYSLSEQLHGQFVEKAPPRPYGLFPMSPPSFFDLDFRYLEAADVATPGLFDPVKRIHLGDDCLLSVFSQTWVRTMTERNVNFTPQDNDHVLFRTRWAGDFWYRDNIRFFAEYLYAERFDGGLDPRPIDINRSELQNLFVEVKAAEFQGRPVYVRVGRQELLLGSQRLVSTLDWANTRRKFQGIRAYYHGEDWTVDAFWVQPVPVERNHWDNVDNNVNFFGLFAARKPVNNRWWEWYYLYLDDTNPASVGRDGVVGGQFIHTLGTRVYGSWGNWLYEVEPMLQFGTHANQDLLAFSVPVGGGYHFQEYPWKPQVMLNYEWATGDDNPGQGNLYTGFNQLYPFGHYYFGFLDLVARRNIHDVVLQVSFWPENWLTCLVQLHNFWLFDAEDALYNADDQPIRRDATGRAGRYVGTELDLFPHRPGHPLRQPQRRLFAHLPGRVHRENRPGRLPELSVLHCHLSVVAMVAGLPCLLSGVSITGSRHGRSSTARGTTPKPLPAHGGGLPALPAPSALLARLTLRPSPRGGIVEESACAAWCGPCHSGRKN